IASDCKAAVEAIGKGSSSEYGAVVLEINQSSRDFISCIFSHEFRTSNVEA
uniref:RNase H type-1 domain-containing protein n=1 Tax=Aegilops tauschii subsp. strangulata TaxID=200361 RepID=A0A453I1R1_AEGTS